MTTKIKKGRPFKYTQDIFDVICARISSGESLRRILKDDEMPEHITFYKWLREHANLATQYARAKEDRADTHADEITEIADNEPDSQKARVMIDARKWVASKLHPRNYGEKMALEHSGKDGAPLQPFQIIIEGVKPDSDNKN